MKKKERLGKLSWWMHASSSSSSTAGPAQKRLNVHTHTCDWETGVLVEIWGTETWKEDLESGEISQPAHIPPISESYVSIFWPYSTLEVNLLMHLLQPVPQRARRVQPRESRSSDKRIKALTRKYLQFASANPLTFNVRRPLNLQVGPCVPSPRQAPFGVTWDLIQASTNVPCKISMLLSCLQRVNKYSETTHEKRDHRNVGKMGKSDEQILHTMFSGTDSSWSWVHSCPFFFRMKFQLW